MKCIVYNTEDSDAKEFYLGCNGINVQGQCGVEVNLKEEYIGILENACIEKPVVTPDKKLVIDKRTNRLKMELSPRFRVIKLEKEDKPQVGRPKKEEKE